MRKYLNKLPKEILDLIYLARDTAGSNNLPIYLVGGFVRDLILGVKNLDLDIVVEGDGIKFAEDFAYALKAKLIRHRRFGTATLVIAHSDLKIDVASARKETYPEPAHLPIVENATLKDDHFRRDFTINAMAISINKDSFGRLIDFFGSQEDLRNKKIRILHDLSFIDDPTRILRAIRFEQRYNFRIEPETLKNLKAAIKLKMLEKVEPQRTRDELVLMLKEARPLKEIKRLKELSGFGFIDRRLSVTKKTYRLISSIEKEISWFKRKYSKLRPIDAWLIYFMGLIDCLGLKDTRKICQRFAFRKGEEKRILNCKKIGFKIVSSLSKKIKPSEVFRFLELSSYEVILLLKAKYKNKDLQKNIADFLMVYHNLRICVSGEDLHRLGISPGPVYQKIFSKILAAKLDGLVQNKEEELALLKKMAKIK